MQLKQVTVGPFAFTAEIALLLTGLAQLYSDKTGMLVEKGHYSKELHIFYSLFHLQKKLGHANLKANIVGHFMINCLQRP